MNWDTHYKHAEKIAEREIDGEIFLVHQETDEICHLDQMGSTIWRLFSTPTPCKEILLLLQYAFPEVTIDTLKHDMGRLIEKLTANGLHMVKLFQESDRKTRPNSGS